VLDHGGCVVLLVQAGESGVERFEDFEDFASIACCESAAVLTIISCLNTRC